MVFAFGLFSLPPAMRRSSDSTVKAMPIFFLMPSTCFTTSSKDSPHLTMLTASSTKRCIPAPMVSESTTRMFPPT